MRLRIWGCRGSRPTPGAEFLRYGGNTTCVEVRLEDGTLLVLDAGTGICQLGLTLPPDDPPSIHLLLTHLHLDHIEGLPFFEPLWRPGTRLHIWGPPSPQRSLQENLSRLMSPPLFPIDLSDIPCSCIFHDVPDEEWSIGSARILAAPVEHPGPTIGYRIEEAGRSFAFIPDHEPALGGEFANLPPAWVSGHAVAFGADLVFHDGQYTEEEYPSRAGWGHSSIAHAVSFARIAKAGQLVLFHHDPNHTDADLDAIGRQAARLWGPGEAGSLVLAAEGMRIDLAVAEPAAGAADQLS